MTLRACSLSAACLYFGLGLSNRMANATTVAGEDEAGVAVPLGMMGVSWGGTLIEQWTNLEHQKACHNISCLGPNCVGNGALYNGMVAPFVNMSVKGFVWCECSPSFVGFFLNCWVFPEQIPRPSRWER